ncbi:Hcp family type VI secretion system effector [Propylenella binzhouense]|uniref:Type VI secretion system tube protein Hcp n=1 Tax=Propylenella binzhouense TaxID=2555902 RepID=A0A964T9R5_9HYPH|nr:type VI secretion system tube protein Hcp [Propylenella binzhouense]MYZ49932.1 type VI secretion system tube protein Hcp [Propylenella binzhouense]
MAVDMFIKIGSLKGESQDKEYSGWIDVLSWSWGLAQSGSAHMGGGQGAGKVHVQDFSFTKHIDIVSPKLWGKAATGEHYDKVEFKARKAGGSPFVYLEITLEDVIVTSVSTGGSGGEDMNTENVTLNFKVFEIKYNQQDEKGGHKADDKFKFDISKNSKM